MPPTDITMPEPRSGECVPRPAGGGLPDQERGVARGCGTGPGLERPSLPPRRLGATVTAA